MDLPRGAGLLLLLFVLASCAPSITKVVVAVDPHWPPMEFLDTAQKPTGFDVDLARELGRQGNFTVEFRVVPWEALFAGLEKGDYDAIASSVVIDTARQSKYDFSEPYLNGGQVLVVPRNSAANRLVDLKGLSIGVQTGTNGAAIAAKQPNQNLKFYDSIELAFQDLAAAKIAGVVTEAAVAARYALNLPRYRGAFKVVGQPLTDENFGLVVKKGNKTLLDTLNASLVKVKASGTLGELAARWFR